MTNFPWPTGRPMTPDEFSRVVGRPKATYGGPALAAYQTSVPLSLGTDPQARMAAYLRAYKVGWFFKAGHKIAGDVAGLERTLSYEDTEGDNEEEIVPAALNVPWESLDPLEQFLRLMEKPNPYQTGRALFTTLQVHIDFTGLGFLYLEGAGGPQLPTGLYTISPVRLTPSRNGAGDLIGWVLDKDAPSGGVPFGADEILPFVVPGASDDPFCGQGVVEAVYSQIPLSDLMARHTADVLTTGGRLAGMLWPKDRTLSEDEFTDVQRAWRNVTSDPNAARRLLIMPEPMEYSVGAASPTEIGIPELATLSRDDILTAFPISPYMLGVPMPGGLNSAETRKEEERQYWGGPIHVRAELIEETIQHGLIPLYEAAVGRPLDFDIEEPDMDDAVALTAKVDALNALVTAGFDPVEAVSAVGLDHIKYAGPPAPPEPVMAPVPDAPDPVQVDPMPMPSAPAPTKSRKARREDVIGRELPGFIPVMAQFYADQKVRLADEVARSLATMSKAERKAAIPNDWWDQAREDNALREALRPLYVRLSRSALQVVADEVDRIVSRQNVSHVTEAMLEKAGTRITGINETTRKAVADQIAEGVRRGYSPAQIANGSVAEGFPGIRNAPAFDEARAELVARTETMLAYNESAIRGYTEFGIERFEAIDGDFDEECEARNGQVFSADEALATEDHPNGTLDWAPIWDKARRDGPSDVALLAEAMKGWAPQPTTINAYISPSPVAVAAPQVNVTTPDVAVYVPEQPAPYVNVEPAAVVVEPASVVVNVPEQAVMVSVPPQPAPVIHLPEQPAPVVHVAVPEPKPVTRTIVREGGQITRIIEEPTDG